MYRNLNCVSQKEIIPLCVRTLNLYDKRLIQHGERVARIAEKILGYSKENINIDKKTLFILCLFHDIGAYKTEEIDRMMEFETKDVRSHSIYGYLFLKYCSPIGETAKALLYHHTDSRKLTNIDETTKFYAELIHISDRIDIALTLENNPNRLLSLISGPQFNMELVKAFQKVMQNESDFKRIKEGSVSEWFKRYKIVLKSSPEESVQYLQMLIYTIDFKSKTTVVHSVSTTAISIYLANLLKMTETQKERIKFAALIHDIGKIAVPAEILEYPGKLDDEKMKIMRNHVVYTEEIVKDILSKEISDIAVRHHEKLDGSGYPHGLTKEELTASDRILEVSDIISALCSRRSYKEQFKKEKVLAIINDMADCGKLDKDIVALAEENFDDMIEYTRIKIAPVTEMYETIKKEYIRLSQCDI